MIKAIIFSKDRAYQLDLFLQSLRVNALKVFDITILYDYSSGRFKRGYEKLMKLDENITWIKQTDNFKKLLLSVINKKFKYTCPFTDDVILYRKINEKEIIEQITDDVLCFSLRFGTNTTYSYAHKGENAMPEFEDLGKFVKWDWTKINKEYAKGKKLDFGYPLSICSHIYRTKQIYDLSRETDFTSVNTYEAHLQFHRKRVQKNLVSYKKSATISIPVNRIQQDYPNNPSGETYPVSVEDFNDCYLKGEVIDFRELDYSNIRSLEQELRFPWMAVPIPIILVYSDKRKELVAQTLKTLKENTEYPYKLFLEEDKIGTPNYIKIRNKLIKNVPYKWDKIVCCDDDLFFSRGWLKLMIKALKENPDVWVVGGTTWYYHKVIEARKDVLTTSILPGTCWLFSRETWEKCGPFVESEFKTKEFCGKVIKQGGKLAFLNDRTKVVHCGIKSLINKRQRGEVGRNYIKSLADKVGAITE